MQLLFFLIRHKLQIGTLNLSPVELYFLFVHRMKTHLQQVFITVSKVSVIQSLWFHPMDDWICHSLIC